MPKRPRLALLAVAATLAVALAVAATLTGSSGRSSSPGPPTNTTSAQEFNGAPVPASGPRDFTLTDQRGRRISLRDFRGRVTILTFLYSTCPTACVLIAQQIRGALDELGPAVPAIVVSVDPAADTPAHVSAFLRKVSLAGRIEYLTGSRAELAGVWRAYGIVPSSAGEASFARSASVLLVDRHGVERVIFQQEQLTPEALSQDVRRLESMP
jgi:protein SCO1/2